MCAGLGLPVALTSDGCARRRLTQRPSVSEPDPDFTGRLWPPERWALLQICQGDQRTGVGESDHTAKMQCKGKSRGMVRERKSPPTGSPLALGPPVGARGFSSRALTPCRGLHPAPGHIPEGPPPDHHLGDWGYHTRTLGGAALPWTVACRLWGISPV